MPTPIEQELLEVTGEKPKGASEEEQDYIARLTRAVTKVPETDWDKLSQPVQDFCNECIRALKRKKTLPGFPDTEENDMATKSKAKKPVKKAPTKAEPEPEAEATEAKTETETKVEKGGRRGRKSELMGTITIVGENTRRQGTKAYDLVALLHKHGGKTVEKYVAAGGDVGYLRTEVKKGRVTLS